VIDREKLVSPGSPEEALFDSLDLERLPQHVAIIMDGNGRWARERRLPRIEGHRAGVKAVREVVETSARLELPVLTLYAFSTENWKRPRFEVRALMGLLREFLNRELQTLLDNDIRIRPIGRWTQLDPAVVRDLERAVDKTRDCQGMIFNIALSYSGRQELTDAVRRLAEEVAAGRRRPDEIDEGVLASALETGGQPDPDLLIRTSGELRVSNFLLWQIAYSEIWVTRTLWPDFRRQHLFEAILAFQKRDRRYGAISSEPAGEVVVRS